MTHFVTFWSGTQLSAYEVLCLNSFVNRGHSIDLYTYDENLRVPAGVVRNGAENVLPKEGFAERLMSLGKLPLLANVIRYRLLSLREGTWIDADLVLLADDLPRHPYLFARQDKRYINNALLRAPRDSELLRRLVDFTEGLDADDAARIVDQKFGTYGPHLLTQTVRELNLESHALSAPQIYPLHWKNSPKMFSPRHKTWCEGQVKNALTLHLWNSLRARAHLSELLPPPGSFIHALMEQHGVLEPGRHMSRQQVRKWQRNLDPNSFDQAVRKGRKRIASLRARVGTFLRLLGLRSTTRMS